MRTAFPSQDTEALGFPTLGSGRRGPAGLGVSFHTSQAETRALQLLKLIMFCSEL